MLSDESKKRRCPEMFPVDFATHQQLYASQDVQKHQLDGIKIPKTPQHIKVKPRYPIYDLFTHAQAVAPLNPSVKSAVGVYRRAISDAVKREPDHSVPVPPTASATLQVTLPQKRKPEEVAREIIRRAAKTALRQGEVEEDHADKSQRTSEGLPDRYGFNPFESARTFIDWQQRTMYVEVDGQFVPRPLPPGV